MTPELVLEFVSKVKSCAPLDVIVAAAAPVPTLVSPDPFGIIAVSYTHLTLPTIYSV